MLSTKGLVGAKLGKKGKGEREGGEGRRERGGKRGRGRGREEGEGEKERGEGGRDYHHDVCLVSCIIEHKRGGKGVGGKSYFVIVYSWGFLFQNYPLPKGICA